MDQNNTPYQNNPQQPPGYPPQQGAQVYQPAPGYPQRSNARRIWTIVLVTLLVLCLCCVIGVVVLWNTGDSLLLQMCLQDPTWYFCPGLLP
jgi:hypothetical protein